MSRLLLCLSLAVLSAACSSPPLVYAPSDVPGAPATGSVRPLRELVPADGTPVRLVFVHGVGDHCSGYALDPDTGWLNDKVAAAIGMTPVGGTTVAPHFVNVSVFMNGRPDARSGVAIAARAFTMKVPGATQDLRVEAIEITWSPLTQWLKSNQLGYDSPSTTPAPGASSNGCTEPADANIPATTAPPPRLRLDRTIKERVFDRNLADAILYSGTYGAVMERGLAEGLCHAVTATADDVKCNWPTPEQRSKSPFRYVFVTHSLGSRMTYDMFLDLLGYQTDAKANPFSKEERDAAGDFIAAMLADTPAFYMMANQLALLGLASVPPTARSGSGIHPFAYPGFETARVRPDAFAAARSPSVAGSTFGDVITRIAMAKALATGSAGRSSAKLQVVAFNDTNDLLTWHVPRWYSNDDVTAPDGRPLIEVVNVFVQNTAKLLVIESPAPAHENYFRQPSVWQIIACGAANGAALQCP